MPQRIHDVSDGLYPMRVVTRLSGLSADTIRAWERRYGAVRPSRTDGKARRYSESEVRRLVLLREATERGHAIGSIGALDEAHLAELVKREPKPSAAAGPAISTQVDAYLERIENFDVRGAQDLLLRSAALLDPREFCLGFLVPLLGEIGRRWEHGRASVVHEHLVSTQVKVALSVYSRLSDAGPDAPKVVFLTPERHLHEFGMQVGAILSTMRGLEPVVLGPDVPYSLLDGVLDAVEPAAVVFGISRDFEAGEFARFVAQVERMASRTRVIIGCSAQHAVNSATRAAVFCHDFDRIDAEFRLLAGTRSSTASAVYEPEAS